MTAAGEAGGGGRRRIAVAGGTGVVGRHVVAALRTAGHEAVVLSRGGGVDVVTGAGLAGALDGVDAVVDVTSVVTTRERPAVAFFTAATRNLLATGVPHHVGLSIAGIDGVRYGYYAGKRAQEALLLADPRSTLLRSTQFHELVPQLLGHLPGPLAILPRMAMRPVAAREVGAVLADLALGAPQGRVPDLAGPRDEALPDLARRYLRTRGSRRRVVAVRLPGSGGKAMAGGVLRGDDAARRGTVDFDTWLRDDA